MTRDLLSRLLVKDPTERLIDPVEIMRHPFFAQIDWESMMERRCTTPYKPEVQGPLDLSHFEAEQTNKPLFSPPDSADTMLISGLHPAAGYQVKDKADLYAASGSDMDEFGDDFYFTQSPTADEMTMPLNYVGTTSMTTATSPNYN